MAEVKIILTAPQVRGFAVCDGGGYQELKETDPEYGNWSFSDEGLQKLTRAIEAAVLSANAGKVPDGFVLVPVEPTSEMLDAKPKSPGVQGQCVNSMRRNANRAMYKAMIAAAPMQQASDAGRQG